MYMCIHRYIYMYTPVGSCAGGATQKESHSIRVHFCPQVTRHKWACAVETKKDLTQIPHKIQHKPKANSLFCSGQRHIFETH